MGSHVIRKRLMGGSVASWLSSSGEHLTAWPGTMYRNGEKVGSEKSKMSLSLRGDLAFRYGWIMRRGKEMER